MKFFTIGIYHRTESDFFGDLIERKIQLFCDVRRRRGIRGKQYAFGNSRRLQESLDDLGIDYWHVPDLAPTTEMVSRQDQVDNETGISRRDRQALSAEFVRDYKSEILSDFDFESFLDTLRQKALERVVLFCLEQNPEACHRSLVAEHLRLKGFEVEHLKSF